MGNPFAAPKIPKPAAPPPPADTQKAYIDALNKEATDRELRKSKGRTNAFSFTGGKAGLLSSEPNKPVEPYRAPGSKTSYGA